MSHKRFLLYILAFVVGSVGVLPIEGDLFWILFVISGIKPVLDVVHAIVNFPLLSFIETISFVGIFFRGFVNIVSGIVSFIMRIAHLNTLSYIVFYLCVGLLL
ncbi:MAG: hypothetical protein K0B02_00365 [DPANN group archaeon]|nr:hypothetical protein [DPANN group archaeon]